jgi:outer membrane protein
MKKIILLVALSLSLVGTKLIAIEPIMGVVNFVTCVTDSKYGKYEQSQLENIRGQWTSLIEDTEKELKELSSKFEDQDYLDSLSPEAEEELKVKYKILNDDMAKYQNQLYQVLNQANYFFVQKMTQSIAKASEEIAKNKKLDMVINKEACFYNKPNLEVTDLVIKEMDKNFDKEEKARTAADSKELSDKDISAAVNNEQPQK